MAVASDDLSGSVRSAEIVAALSLAADIAVGQPMEHGLRTCVLAMRLGEACGLGSDELAEVFWCALLQHAGCNADGATIAALFGDDLLFKREVALVDVGRPAEMLPFVFATLRRANAGASVTTMLSALVRGLATSGDVAREALGGNCEVAQRIAGRLGFPPAVLRDLGQVEERWDGRGFPDRLKGEAIAPAVRVNGVARDFVVLSAAIGSEAAAAKLAERRGRAYDPRIVERFLLRLAELTDGLDGVGSWGAVLAVEPRPWRMLDASGLDAACVAMADFADLRSPWTHGHSRAVADLACAAAEACGLPVGDVAATYRAGLLHDIGQSAVPVTIWLKPGPLTEREWDEVRLHPYYGERVLCRAPALAGLASLVGQHHERIDSSGYYRGVSGPALSPPARILAVAEAYRGMVEDRPHRPALPAERAAAALQAEARAGRLDPAATAAVLASAGHAMRRAPPPFLAGLTEREIEVLRLVARGRTTKEIARTLGIAPKTADNHIQNLYPKIGVRTRAGATLFAIERGLAAGSEPSP